MDSDQIAIGTMVEQGTNEIAHVPAIRDQAPQIAEMMTLALQQGPEGVEALQKLVELHRQVSREDDERALVAALAAFKADCPPIKKTKAAGEVGRAGTSKGWMYAPLDETMATIAPHLSRHGLTVTWDSEPAEGGRAVVCKVQHVRGAVRTATVVMPDVALPKSERGGPHSVGASLSYAQRYSLNMVLGLAASEDNDGMGPRPGAGALVTEEQLANLQAVWDEVRGNVKQKAFFEFYGIAKLSDMPAARYEEALAQLERRRKA